MKLDSITLQNFGVYSNRRFDFRRAPLVLIYGLNEAGKTTALNGIRQALFGFRPRTPYLMGTGGMSAQVEARLRNGSALQFTRQKGRPDKVDCLLDGQQIRERQFLEIMGEWSLDSYESLFGFSQVELTAGQETLKSAQLAEALAGGGMYGINALENLRTELSTSLAELYKSRGSTSEINVKLNEIKVARENLRIDEVPPQAIEAVRRDLNSAESEAERLQQQFADLQSQAISTQKTIDALPYFRERQSLNQQIEQLDIPDQLDSGFVTAWKERAKQRQELQTQLQRERDLLWEDESAWQSLSVTTRVLEHDAVIDVLGHKASQIAGQRESSQQWQRELASYASERERLLKTLGLESSDPRLVDLQLDAEQSRRCAALGTEAVRWQESAAQHRQALQTSVEALELVGGAAGTPQAIPPNLGTLADLVGQLAEREHAFRHRTADVEKRLGAEDVGQREVLQRLLLDGQSLEFGWSIPDEIEIDEMATQSEKLASSRERCQSQLREIAAEIEVVESAIATASTQGIDGLQADLAQLASQRDALISDWVDELDQPLLAASISHDTQQERLRTLALLVGESDQLVQKLLDQAETVASVRQRTQALARLKQRATTAEQDLATIDKHVEEFAAQWRELWNPLPVQVVSFARMKAWAAQYRSWQQQQQTRDNARKELRLARQQIQSLRLEIVDQWPKLVDADTDLKVLQGQIEQWEDLRRDWSQAEQKQRAALAKQQAARKQLEQADRQLETLDAEFATWLEALPFPLKWPVGEAQRLVELLERMRRTAQTVSRLESQLAEAEEDIGRFCEQVQQLAREMAHETPADVESAEALARKWLRELQDNRQQKVRRAELDARIQHRKERCAAWTKELNTIDDQLAALTTAKGFDTASGVGELVERLSYAESLRVKLGEVNAKLSAFCTTQTFDSFVTELAAQDDSQLVVQHEELQRQIASTNEERTQIEQTIGSLKERLGAMSNNESAQRESQILRELQGDLTELCDQWIVIRLAHEMLTRSIDLFSSENEPQLLGSASGYLAKLTDGKYLKVEHDSQDKNKFFVRDRQGAQWAPDRLSTGAREQLFLAIRMAFIDLHCSEHEPLPVIMDDCFVNFDDQRATNALDVIANWDDSIQTVLLSCHARIPRMLASIAPETPVINLSSGDVKSASEAAPEMQAEDYLVP